MTRDTVLASRGNPDPHAGALIALAQLVPEWMVDALCAQIDPEMFFPEKGGSTRDAKKICAACPARLKCLDYALENQERYGIYGGLSERERRKITHLRNTERNAS